jgi:hypothetical protein
MLIYGRAFLVFPFGKDRQFDLTPGATSSAAPEAAAAAAGRATVLQPFLVRLGFHAAATHARAQVDMDTLGVRTIKDFVFLEGYNEPSLLVLHEERLTFAGYTRAHNINMRGRTHTQHLNRRYAVAENTAALVNLSLNLSRRSHSSVSTATNLPHDSYR